MRKKKTLIFSVLCGLVCAACVLLYTQGVRGQAEAARVQAMAEYGGQQVEVCVAKTDIAAGEVLSAGSIETRTWLADMLPAGAVTNAQDVVGKQLSSSILAGEVVSTARFGTVNSAIEVPAGTSALSVPAKEVQAVGGAISPGSLVDVYVTGDSTTQVVAQNVQVLATGQALQESSSSTTSNGSTSWVTLAVKPAQVQELVAAAARAQLYFVLPSKGAGAQEGAAVESETATGEGSAE